MAEHWLRLWHGTVTDPKFRMVARDASRNVTQRHAESQREIACHAVLSVWLYLLETASQNEDRGSIEGLDAEVMAFTLDMPAEDAEAILEAMESRGLIEDNRLNGWEKRQPKREDNTAAERQRARRERHAESRNVTQCHAESRPVTTEEKRGEEKREDKKDQEHGRSQGSRLPADWSLTAEYRQAAAQARPDWPTGYVETVAASFRDYWIAQPGAKGRKVDWLATWRNWCRNDRSKPVQGLPTGQPKQRVMLSDRIGGQA